MNNDAFWSIILLLIALVIVAIECLIPTGGVLAVVAVATLAAAVFLAFKAGITWGFGVVLVIFFAVPATIILMFRMLPFTPWGRKMLSAPEPLPVDPNTERLERLVGQIGVAHTELLPAGIIEVAGERLDAIGPGIAIPKGQAVEVVRVAGGAIYVTPTEKKPNESSAAGGEGELGAERILEKSLKDLGLEDLERPLG